MNTNKHKRMKSGLPLFFCYFVSGAGWHDGLDGFGEFDGGYLFGVEDNEVAFFEVAGDFDFFERAYRVVVRPELVHEFNAPIASVAQPAGKANPIL